MQMALFIRSRGVEICRSAGALTDQAVYHVFRQRAAEAGVEAFSPHGPRRTYIGDLLGER